LIRKYIALIVLSVTIMIGCNPESETNVPVESPSEKAVNWITLPSPSGMSVNSVSFTNSERIKGRKGGHVMLVTEYDGGPHGVVKIDSKLEIKQRSFRGTLKISTTCFPEEGLINFEPSSAFDKDLEYTLVYEGIDLSGVDPNNVAFCYIDADGSVVETENLGIDVDVEVGKIKVDKALIPHF
jgi:hypothetical protein